MTLNLDNSYQLNNMIFLSLEKVMSTPNNTNRAFESRKLYVIFDNECDLNLYTGSLIKHPNIEYKLDYKSDIDYSCTNTRRCNKYLMINPKFKRVKYLKDIGVDYDIAIMENEPSSELKVIKDENDGKLYVKVKDEYKVKFATKLKLVFDENRQPILLERVYGALAEVKRLK